ncbi:MAG: helix-turn-helix transcriptional regulator [Clostridia bacterium]|nr:helix-turn-helix transcriptional regulator [Clostridia bacterium]
MKYYEAVGIRLNELLKEKGITKKEIARKTEISYRCVLRISKGQSSRISLVRFYQICKAIEIPPDVFFDSPLFDFGKLEK